jgi:D-hexose-6-phosphate mutarotase
MHLYPLGTSVAEGMDKVRPKVERVAWAMSGATRPESRKEVANPAKAGIQNKMNMNTKTIDQLNKAHAFQQEDQSLRIVEGKGGIPLVEIQNKHASATISLQGAHLLTWQPINEKQSVIWLSEDAKFAPGKSIRGGIPICWPWFGAHASHADYPAHGFARTSLWKIVSATPLDTGETQITFKLELNIHKNSELDNTFNNTINTITINEMWPQPTAVEYRLTIGCSLILELTTTNHSDQAITLGQALHTYFAVDDIAQTTVEGLDGKTYLDKPQNFARKTQTGPVTFSAEVDRIYLNTPESVVINDSKRKITISKQGSRSTVVWNPWQAVAEKMGDLGKDGYQKMVCVESANAAEDVVSIQPGKSHTLHVVYEIESLV